MVCFVAACMRSASVETLFEACERTILRYLAILATRRSRDRVPSKCVVLVFVVFVVTHLQLRAGRTRRLLLPIYQGNLGYTAALLCQF